MKIDRLNASVFVIPTDAPESDGTLEWTETTLVLVEITAGAQTGIGYTYADEATGRFVHEVLAREVVGEDPMAVPRAWKAMVRAVRNHGRAGVASMAISAVDTALWDLKARLLGLPLVTLLGQARASVRVYGSGGFTSYGIDRLRAQLGGWAEQGMGLVKMKVGRDPAADVERARAAREAIGARPELFVDANGGYTAKQALHLAAQFAALGVTWFEEPVSSDDLSGLHLVRARAPAPIRVAAGEYGYDPYYFRRMLEAQAVDVLQADASRCGGPTGFLRAAALADAWQVPLSAHCAPCLHLHPCLAIARFENLEYFHDHVRIERALFDGFPELRDGALWPDLSRPGMGLDFKRQDAARYARG